MLKKYPWSPYIGGGLSGILLALSVLWVHKFFGTSAAFVRLSAAVMKIIAPSKVDELIYFIKHPPKVDWKVMFVTGMFVGSLISSLISGSFSFRFLPALWEERLGPHYVMRALTAFVGGILIMIGARLAGGCPSGHGLSGMSTLSVGSMITMAGFIVGGIVSANIIYRVFGRRRV